MTAHIRAKKSLGQNFLTDPHYLVRIVEAAEIGPGDRVLEIGPGLGHLTRLLALRAKQVIALELDDRLIPVLQAEFGGNAHVGIVHADALEYPYESLRETWKVVANLPYYISTPLIQRLLAARPKFSSLTLMLQKEVAERIAAPPGGKEYGYLSVLVQFYAEPRVLFFVPPGAFAPRPKIESAVMTIRLRNQPAVWPLDEKFFIRVVKAAFSQRRKTLRNALKQLQLLPEKIELVQERTGINLGRRAETLSVQDFGRISEFLRQ